MFRYIGLLVVVFMTGAPQADVLQWQSSHAISSPSDVAVSPDGTQLYAASLLGNSIEVMARDAVTGNVSVIETKSNESGLIYPRRVLVSSDGQFIYVITHGSLHTSAPEPDSLLVFKRGSDGKLSFVEAHQNGSGVITAMSLPSDMVLSRNGDQLYVRAAGSNSLLVFNRDITTGALSLFQTLTDGVEGAYGLGGEGQLAVSADGHVYTTSVSGNSVSMFARNVGLFTNQFVWVGTYSNATTGVSGLNGALGAAISPDDKHLYVTGGGDDAITVFTRDAVTGELTFKSAYNQGDVNLTGNKARSFDGLIGSTSVQVSPDGQRVYVTGLEQGNPDSVSTLAVMRRDPTDGSLSFMEAHRSTSAAGLGGVARTSLSPDGSFLYSAGMVDGSVGVFNHLAADLSLVVLEDADPVNLGEVFNYTLTVTNNSEGMARGVAVSNVLPSQASFVAVDSPDCAHVSGVVKCELDDLAGGEHMQINVQVTAPVSEAQLSNSAAVFSEYNDVNPADNLDQEVTTVANLTPNVAPVTVDDVAYILPGTYILLDIVANDQDGDGDALTIVDKSVIKQTDASSGGKLLIYDDTRTGYWPQAPKDGKNFTGTETFSYRVSDGKGGVAEGLVTIVVNTAPIAVDDEASSLPGKSLMLDVLGNDHDEDDDALTIVSVIKQSDATQGTLTINDGTQVTYMPPGKQNGHEYTGTDTFIYRVQDSNGAEDEGLVTITVNTPPVADDDTAKVTQGLPVTILVLINDNDPDGNDIQIASIDTSTLNGGSVQINDDGTITYASGANYIGTEVFNYTIQDTHGATTQAYVTVQVQAADVPIVGDSEPVILVENGGGGAIDVAFMLLLLAFASLPVGCAVRTNS